MGTGSIHRLSIAARLSAALGAYVLISACGTLIGWAFDLPWLTSWDGVSDPGAVDVTSR